jgi:hypothetical protein
MITMGDEYGHTKGGNNNTYCHDSAVSILPTISFPHLYSAPMRGGQGVSFCHVNASSGLYFASFTARYRHAGTLMSVSVHCTKAGRSLDSE